MGSRRDKGPVATTSLAANLGIPRKADPPPSSSDAPSHPVQMMPWADRASLSPAGEQH